MTTILSIDPGPTESGWLILEDGQPHPFGIYPNDQLLECLRRRGFAAFLQGIDHVAIETIEPRYGLQMGWETLDTARWIGRFQEAITPIDGALLRRSEVLKHLGVVTSPKKGEKRVSADAGVRQALIDRFGGIQTTRKGGPLFGISRHVWAALAVAVTYADQLEALAA